MEEFVFINDSKNLVEYNIFTLNDSIVVVWIVFFPFLPLRC